VAIFRAEQGVGSSNLPGRAISFLFNDLREKRSSAFLTDDRDEMLGVEGLEELVRKSAQKTLPEMKQAILAGMVIVALPMFGDYFTNDLLSGAPSTSMIGNLIDDAVGTPGQGSIGAVLVLMLMIILILPMLYYVWSTARATRERVA